MKSLQLLAGAVGVAVILLTMQDRGYGQVGRGGTQANQAPPSAKAAAPFDATGYWVSVITNNWRFRMVPPAKGDYAGIPISVAGKKIADAWDPARDEAAGNQCKYYGAGSIMYQPTRIHVTWQDDNSLRMDIDAGTQTRLFRFGNRTAPQGKPTWQGNSVAVWEARRANNAGRGNNGGRGNNAPAPSARYLKVTTTNMLPGYLRKNGVPYGEGTLLTEYYDLFQERDGTTMLIVTAVVQDSVNLEQRYIVISHFKKEPDGAKWDPTPCSARW